MLKNSDVVKMQLALNANNLERRRHVSRGETQITADLMVWQTERRHRTEPEAKTRLTFGV